VSYGRFGILGSSVLYIFTDRWIQAQKYLLLFMKEALRLILKIVSK
jgi:hypothetical protein